MCIDGFMEAVTCNLFLLLSHSSSALGTPSQTSLALTTTTTSSGMSLMPTTATSHPLQTGTSTAAVSLPPPGFYGQDLSSGMGGNYSQAMGMGGQPTGVGTTHYSQAMGVGGQPTGGGTPHYSQAMGVGGQPTGVGTPHYSQAMGVGGQPTGVGTPHYSQAMGVGGQPTGVGTPHYSQAMGMGSQPTGGGTPQYSQTSWGDATSGGGMNYTAAKYGHPEGEQYHGQQGVGGQQGVWGTSNYTMRESGQQGVGKMNYSQAAAGNMQSGLGYGGNVVTAQPGPQEQWSKERGRAGNERPGANYGVLSMYVTLYCMVD